MKKRKMNIAVLMGGKSPEYDISIMLGIEVVKNLNKEKYNVYPIVISKDGNNWFSVNTKLVLSHTRKAFAKVNRIKRVKRIQGVSDLVKKSVDLVFIAMHGPFSEDGTIQGTLELAGLKYTGSGVLASAIGMDKIMFRKIMISEKFPIPKYLIVKKGEKVKKISERLGNPPYFVKPFNQGSSVGASVANNNKELATAMSLAFKYSNKILIDEYLNGLELTCPIIGNDNPVSLPVVEIHPLKEKFFDYKSKYTKNGSKEIVPARISRHLTKKIQKIAVGVYKALGCRGFARVDFILKDNKYPYVLEVNTIPGLTAFSLFPKSAKAAGITYSDLIDKIINYAKE